MLERTGHEYRNTAATDLFLDRAKPSYVGGLLEMANARLYPFWGALTESLRTGRPQNEIKAGGSLFEVLYQNPDALKQFLHAMTGASMGAAHAIAENFPWDRYQTVVDIGAAEGCVPVQLALRHPHLSGGGFDLPAVEPFFPTTSSRSASHSSCVSTLATSSPTRSPPPTCSSWATSSTTGPSRRS